MTQTELEFSDLSGILDDLPPDVAAAEALLDAAAGVSSVSSLKAARDRRTQEALAKQESEAAADSEIQHDVDQLEDALETDVAVPDTAGPRKKRGERRRVPSWDEIMFGGKDDLRLSRDRSAVEREERQRSVSVPPQALERGSSAVRTEAATRSPGGRLRQAGARNERPRRRPLRST